MASSLYRMMLQAEVAESETIAGVTDMDRKMLLESIVKGAKELLCPEPVATPDSAEVIQDAPGKTSWDSRFTDLPKQLRLLRRRLKFL